MFTRFIFAALIIALTASGCSTSPDGPPGEVHSRAYAGHESDRDIRNLVLQYPATAGTRLDDCQTCHRGGVEGTDTAREFSPCGYCHLIEFPNPKYATGVPTGFEDTLNAYGLAYKRSGRSVAALQSIADADSDGDGFSNSREIAENRYPGDSASRPGQPLAPTVSLDWNRIGAFPEHAQFMLMNRTTQQFDLYTTYGGVRVKDLLEAAGVDLRGAAGITVFAPDGYSIDYTVEEVLEPFPRGFFYAAPGAMNDEEKRFVQYPDTIPYALADGAEIPDEPWLLLAFEQEGKPLEVSHYEKESGRLLGEGPYRLVKPMRHSVTDAPRPARPDRAVKSQRCGDGWDYSETIDHNAGNSVRGATAIRVNPMPAGYEEYDWKNGWPLIQSREIVIFGKGVGDR